MHRDKGQLFHGPSYNFPCPDQPLRTPGRIGRTRGRETVRGASDKGLRVFSVHLFSRPAVYENLPDRRVIQYNRQIVRCDVSDA